MAEDLTYTGNTAKKTHKVLWAVSGVLVLLLVGNLVYFLATSNSNQGNKSTQTTAANLSTISTSMNSSKSIAMQVSPSVIKDTIPATATTPEYQVSFEALDKILGVGEKCTQKQKFITKIITKSAQGDLVLKYTQSDGYTSGDFKHSFAKDGSEFFSEYTWDTTTGTYYMDLVITSPVEKTYRVGFVNQCIN